MKSLDMHELTKNNYIKNPFPLSLDSQKRLLELIYNRKSGIITRQELIDVLFNPEKVKKGVLFQKSI
jgi:DNA-binding winged helix-turn-helix (wHTH) protein